jgi:hypothetical protein
MGAMTLANPGIMNGSPSIYVPGKLRTTLNPYFDTLVAAAAAAIVPGGTQKLFLSVRGKDKAPWLTNMQRAGEITGVNFLCKALRVAFIGCAAADIANFMMSNTVRLVAGAGNLAYADAPAEWWAGGCGVNGQPNNGVPDPRAVMEFEPIQLTDGVSFYVEIVGDAGAPVATAAFFARFYLEGQMGAPPQ